MARPPNLKSSSTSSASASANPQARSLHDYQLGDSLGKGAFGQVYRALNWATGETVAIKQISLNNIPTSQLSSIMSEISLLKNLRHPNIVKYKGFVKTRMHLYIILEFCENGSLAQIGKRFGKFPERLVGVYVGQVLEGLCYLHEQGVIHRDIKGANILTNKDGTVKLADFGVASSTTTPSGSSSAEVVGSPYWMAPEVIEQSGATTASDIWSLGCVVIELLEGSPPYSFLDPMPALWRIVQDDYPPIPEGASAVVKDFLRSCFQKDPNLRISARKLLRHPWIVGVRAIAENETDSAGEQTQTQTATRTGGSEEDWTASSTNSSTFRLSNSSSSSRPSQKVPSNKSSPLPSKSPAQTVSLSKSQVGTGTQRQRQQNPTTQKSPTLRNNKPQRPVRTSKTAVVANAGGDGRPTSQYGYDEAVLRVQEWNQALSSIANMSSLPSSTSMGNMTIKPQPLAMPVPGMSTHEGGIGGSGSAGSAPTIRPFHLTPVVPSVSVTSSISSSSGSGYISPSSSDQSKTIKPVFTPAPIVSGKKDRQPNKKKGKQPILIPPSLNPLGTLNPLGGLAGALADKQKQLAFVEEEDEMDPNRDRWDDDFELGEGDEDFAARSKIDVTKMKVDNDVRSIPGSIRAEAKVRSTLNGSSSGSDGEDETLTSTSNFKPKPRERDDRTIRASPRSASSSLPRSSSSASSSRLSPSPPRSPPSRPPLAAVMNRSASDTVSGTGKATTYHAISEAEEENYDDDFLDDDDSEDGDALLERRVSAFKAKTASQRLQNNENNQMGSLSRPLFHPDDIKSALFPQATESAHIPSSSLLSTSKPNSHGRTYSASASSISPSSTPFSAPLPSPSSGPRRPQLTLTSSFHNDKRISPGPMTAPLPNVDGDDENVWDANYEYDNDYDYPSPVAADTNGLRSGGSIRRVDASQRGSVRSAGNGSESSRRVQSGFRTGSQGKIGNGVSSISNKRGSIRSLSEKFDKYTEYPEDEAETMDFEYEDDNDSPASTVASGGGSSGSKLERPGTLLKLNSRLSNRSWLGDEDEEDVFAEFDEPFAEDDIETHLQRDKHARLSARVGKLIDDLSFNVNPSTGASAGEANETNEDRLRDIVEEILTILVTSPEMQTQLVGSHGMLAILEVLESYQSRQNSVLPTSASSSSPSPTPSPISGSVPLPGTGTGAGGRKSGGMGMVSSLGLGSLASLGSLGLGGRLSSAVSSTPSGGSVGVSGNVSGQSTVASIGGLSVSGRDIVLQLLRIVNLLVTGNTGFLESFCLIGGIPVIMGFTSKRYPSDCRLEASNFIRLLCTSVLTLQMFISCRGLKVLVNLLDEDCSSAGQAPLVSHALDGITSVFELQSPTTKNDFCRMFVKEGLLDPLSGALLNVMANGNALVDGRHRASEDSVQGAADSRKENGSHSTDSSDFEGGMKMKIINILLVFSQVSQSDLHVRNAVGTRKVVRRLLRACELLEPECLVLMLKAVKHLSMNVTLLDVLQNANTIEILVRILEEQSAGPHSTEVSNHVFQTYFNLCRLNKSRQEEAAQAGIIPFLQRVAETQSPLKQFALPILCDMASAGKSCRMLLWQHDGLNMYLKFLEDPYFQVSALESILSWLQDEAARVEVELIKPGSISVILDCFVTAKASSFENLLELFLKLTRISTRITTAFSRSPAFFQRVADRLAHSSKPVIRLNLLKILKSVCEAHPNRGTLVERYGSENRLLGVIEDLSRGGGDGAVLVRELAKEIIPVFQPGLKPLPTGSRPSGRVVTPKRIRRTASEASAGSTGSPATVGVAAGNVISSSGKGASARTASRIASARPKARHKLGDIPWQGPGAG